MSSKYKPGEAHLPHFVTFSVVGWIDVFTRLLYRDIILDSLNFCCDNKGMNLHAWVVMSNHIHLIISSDTNKIENIVRDFKKFTSKRIINAIIENPVESRKEWMINMFTYVGSQNKNNTEFQFWKQDYHPITLSTPEMLRQRLHYLHENPVRAGIVWVPEEFKYSSAIDYLTPRKGLLKVKLLIC